MTTLADTQAAFFRLVTDPERIESEVGLGLFSASGGIPVDQRIRIYSEMYFWRLVDVLRNDFPKLAAILGGDDFSTLVGRYLRRHPSEHPDVGQVGRHLVSFLRADPNPAYRADLADLAELEQARSEVFLETDSQPIDASVISGLGAAFSAARLRLVPALQLRRFEYQVAPVWRAIEEEQAPPPPLAQANEVAVWRKEFTVYHVVLSAKEAEAMRRAISGARVEQVCAAFADHSSPAEAAFAALSSWFVEGWIAALETEGA